MAVYSWVSGDALDTAGRNPAEIRSAKAIFAARRKRAEKKKREEAARAARAKREQEAKLREESRKAREKESIQKALKEQLKKGLEADGERLFAATPVVLKADMDALFVRASVSAPGLDEKTRIDVVGEVLGLLVKEQSVSKYTGDASPETVYIRLWTRSKSQNSVWEDLLKRGIINKGVNFDHAEFEHGIKPMLPHIPPSDALLRKPVLAVFWHKYIAYRIRAAQAAAAAAAAAGPFE